jgi:DNA-directed RNA polymerase subunit L
MDIKLTIVVREYLEIKNLDSIYFIITFNNSTNNNLFEIKIEANTIPVNELEIFIKKLRSNMSCEFNLNHNLNHNLNCNIKYNNEINYFVISYGDIKFTFKNIFGFIIILQDMFNKIKSLNIF